MASTTSTQPWTVTEYGVNALSKNLSINNTAFGSYAAMNNTSGDNNTAVGCNASLFNTSGDNNTAVGAGCLTNNAGGSLNTAVGSSALEGTPSMSAGEANTAVGVQTLYVNEGAMNTALGAYAGLDLLSGSYNTCLGANSSVGASASFATAIGYNAVCDASNTIMLGGLSTTTDSSGAGEYPVVYVPGPLVAPAGVTCGPVSVSGEVSAASVSVTGEVSAASMSCTALEVTTNSSSVPPLQFGFIAGNSALGMMMASDVNQGSSNVGAANLAIGVQCFTANTTGGSNVAIGQQTLQNNTTGSNNVAIGALSLALCSTGYNNVGIGASTLINNASGMQNVAIGSSSQASCTTGYDNITAGSNSLRDNTNGYENVAIGVSALQSHPGSVGNVAIGQFACAYLTSGSNNTCVGFQSCSDTTTSSNNTAIGANTAIGSDVVNNTVIGANAGYSNSGGSYNTCLGANTGGTNSSTTPYTNSTAVGYNATFTASNQIMLGGANAQGNFPAVQIPGLLSASSANSGVIANISFTEALTTSNNTFYSVAQSQTGQYVCVTTNGAIYVSSTYGASYGASPMSIPTVSTAAGAQTIQLMAAVSPSGQYMSVIANASGNMAQTTVYYSSNYGQGWSSYTFGTQVLTCNTILNSGQIYTCSLTNNCVAVLNASSTIATTFPFPATYSGGLVGVIPNSTDNTGNTFIVALNNNLYFTESGGGSWSTVALPYAISGSALFNNVVTWNYNVTNIFICTTNGVICSTNGGSTFTTTPPQNTSAVAYSSIACDYATGNNVLLGSPASGAQTLLYFSNTAGTKFFALNNTAYSSTWGGVGISYSTGGQFYFNAFSSNLSSGLTPGNWLLLNGIAPICCTLNGTSFLNGSSTVMSSDMQTALTVVNTGGGAGACPAVNIQSFASNEMIMQCQSLYYGGSILYDIMTLRGSGDMWLMGTLTSSNVTSSDYRIKENVVPLTAAKAQPAEEVEPGKEAQPQWTEEDPFVVDKLRPVKYFNRQIQRVDYGFIAHELQEVFPDLVLGEKDGEQMQAVNYTGLIAVLVKEIQTLKRQVAELQSVSSSSASSVYHLDP